MSRHAFGLTPAAPGLVAYVHLLPILPGASSASFFRLYCISRSVRLQRDGTNTSAACLHPIILPTFQFFICIQFPSTLLRDRYRGTLSTNRGTLRVPPSSLRTCSRIRHLGVRCSFDVTYRRLRHICRNIIRAPFILIRLIWRHCRHSRRCPIFTFRSILCTYHYFTSTFN